MLTPDVFEHIYDTDAPDIGKPSEATDSHEKYVNFTQWVSWNDDMASDLRNWYWQGFWKAGGTPEEITLKDVGTGSIVLPDEDGAYYDPP